MSGAGWVGYSAPAKVNPWLEVLGRRPDGYHELETSMLALELADRVYARARREPGITLELSGPAATEDVPADERNLAWRAAAALLAESGAGGGMELRVVKNVPSRAGLGGGSSDAAAAWCAAREALGSAARDLSAEGPLAALGSDCVFFEKAALTGFALCSGRGERVRPQPLDDTGWTIALVVPSVACPTPEVYAALDSPLRPPKTPPSLARERLGDDARDLRGALHNRLETAALRRFPELQDWRALLDDCDGRHVRLSGSGSAFFGLFRDPAEASALVDSVQSAARRRGLELRGSWVTRPAGRGAVRLNDQA